ncbi:hypothetical protein HWB54_gp10 [Pseudomonas phage vB_PaeM_LS1]|uniref:Uncharacterized protein n=4 Tax=Pbunavirus TaxID=1198980 RepID=A0A649V3K9_9CAUD|nr:hypothetical protein HWB54_gp10 [Pseudomonas phage vB_PaeM_LS1]AVJ48779.1 hypothetical protein vBPaeMLS1_10 [Pseudomonas phage vB_PaeM_LS1]QGJ86978.1 hypothetical protein SMS12_028 [Pseudomonas phage vB_PaeM_SMS12]QGJ87066.1 hypothetical protein SMS21_028 [Pseudomonas phage vB_PaeM_SMS21]QGJ87095.1 hypothetical protein SMS29_029 [Pseudomonas phage vB_PaeM_SMS29]
MICPLASLMAIRFWIAARSAENKFQAYRINGLAGMVIL